jgi:hypothetical protein
MTLAMDMLIVHFRLIQSALDQKAEAKLMGLPHRERSQGSPEMGSREVACLPGGMELPLGRNCKRATLTLAKFASAALYEPGRVAAHAVSGRLTVPVIQAITNRIWNVRFTDEVPRRPVPQGQVSLSYKSHTKGRGDASEAGRASPRPRLKGCQQRQSRGLRWRLAVSACSERQNLRVPCGPLGFTGPVSPATAATKWPDGTSSRQLAGLLSNSPQQPKLGRTAVRSR